MTIKQLCRKRNKLVSLATKIKGEEQKALELCIKLIDIFIDNSFEDEEQNNEPYLFINYDTIHFNQLKN